MLCPHHNLVHFTLPCRRHPARCTAFVSLNTPVPKTLLCMLCLPCPQHSNNPVYHTLPCRKHPAWCAVVGASSTPTCAEHAVLALPPPQPCAPPLALQEAPGPVCCGEGIEYPNTCYASCVRELGAPELACSRWVHMEANRSKHEQKTRIGLQQQHCSSEYGVCVVCCFLPSPSCRVWICFEFCCGAVHAIRV